MDVTPCRHLSLTFDRIKIKYYHSIVYRVEKNLLEHLSRIPYEQFENYSFYEKINFAGQVSNEYQNVIYSVSEMIRILIMAVLYIYALSKINAVYLCIMISTFVLSTVISVKVIEVQLDYWRIHVSPESRRRSYFRCIFGGRINHQNIQQTNSFRFFSKKNREFSDKERANYIKLNLLTFLTEIISSLLYILTFAGTGRQTHCNKLRVFAYPNCNRTGGKFYRLT